VDEDLDGRVAEHGGQRGWVERLALVERIEHVGPHAALLRRVGNGDLHEAEQGLVTPLGHELRVDRELSVLACQIGQLLGCG
jgi:hypothetical protein